MARGDVDFREKNNTDVTIEDKNGLNQRASLVVVANGLSDTNNPLDVAIQDQSTDIVDYYICRDLFELTLSATLTVGSYTVPVVSGASVVNNTYICIQESARAFQAKVLSGGGTNSLVLDTPIDYAFTVAASIWNRSPELAGVNGSVTPVVARLAPAAGVKWDVTRIIGNILTPFANGAPSDIKFGGATALARGVVIRKSNGEHHTIFNVKTNGDIKLRTGPSDVVYAEAAPSTSYGVGFRRTFSGQEKNGVVVRLDGDEDDELQVVIQDDMTGFTSFKVVAQGHVVED